MARYKTYDYSQSLLLPVELSKQLQPGTLEYTINEVVTNHVDTKVFDSLYNNDKLGAPAYDPAILLKIILLAYSRGILSSRKIALACQENIIFKALSCDTQPDFTTIASFICRMNEQVENIFADVLLLCFEMKLVGGEIFSIDGCKLSSNAAKEWSGTFKDFEKKRKKLKDNIKFLKKKIQSDDYEDNPQARSKKEIQKTIKKMQKRIKKIDSFITENEPKKSKRWGESQSNITDNESAKMKTSHGVIQGYNGIAVADSKHQIVLYAEAFGSGPEQDLLQPVMNSARTLCQEKEISNDIFEHKILIADTGSFSDSNLEYLDKAKVDAYIPDNNFRKRDERFKDRDRYKEKPQKKKFNHDDFIYDTESNQFVCPNGKKMPSHGVQNNGKHRYRSYQRDCTPCPLREQCLRNPESKVRNLYMSPSFFGRNFAEEMKNKIDTEYGRDMYSKRMGIIEPIFGNIRGDKKMDHFTLRTKAKVNIQWMLYCLVHNIEKLKPCLVS